jgi:nitronate monooxygenase
MGGVAGGALAAAVSRAGGLGMIGIGSTGSVALLDEELRDLSELGRPFGVGLVDWVIANEPALLEAAIGRQAGVGLSQFRRQLVLGAARSRRGTCRGDPGR